MKNIPVILFFLLINSYVISAQNNPELKKICLDKMPNTYDQIKDLDTIFILYYKSDLEKFEQNAVNIIGNDFNNYNFFNEQFFPLKIYDEIGYEKVNFREPKIMYKSKKFICKNMYRTIDAQYIVNWGHFFCKKGCNEKMIIFIIELDISINNYYRITQVGTPIISTF